MVSLYYTQPFKFGQLDKNIVQCSGDYCSSLDWRFKLLTTHTFTTHDYNLQITDTHGTVSSVYITVSTSCFLATDFNNRTITVSLNYTLQASHMESSLHSHILATNFISRPHLQASADNWVTPTVFKITPQHGPDSNPIVIEAGLPCHCTEMAVVLLFVSRSLLSKRSTCQNIMHNA
jgi:hypothetical protein